jgi:hypothetical protein
MKKNLYRLSFIIMTTLMGLINIEAQTGVVTNTTPIAFPGAEGFGRFTSGGRGGKVIYVTNLNDSGTGSFREAVEKSSGARIVVFRVGGVINLQSRINIRNGNLTIAGQTAPGDGITLKNHTVYVGASNVIIRFLRFRMGDEHKTEDDSMWGRNQNNVIIDHCSLSWGTDEVASFYDNSNFTLQWCILSESLRNSVHDKGQHGYLGIWGGKKASFHHNLIAHHDSRNPRFCGSRWSNRPDLELVDFRNNVLYNWGNNSGYAGEGGSYNIVNNYYKSGPATKSSARTRIFQPYGDDGSNAQKAGVWGTFYVNGNFVSASSSVTSNNWDGVTPSPTSKNKSDLRSNTEFAKGQITTHTAQGAYESVLSYAGSSFKRDAVDSRVVTETRNGTFTYNGSNGSQNGLIDSQKDVGGWPSYSSGSAPADTDGDGIPDAWEIANGLNPNNANDGKEYTLSTMFTNVEVYINSLVQNIMDAKNSNGTANYVDITGGTAPGNSPPALFKHGSGSSSQTVDINQAIADFNFRWENATTVTVSGVPQGITANIDNAQKRVFFSGAPTQAGVFDYTVRTSGGSGTAEMSGRFTVIGSTVEPPALYKHDTGASSQTIDVNQSIVAFNFRWENATTVTVSGVPQGITANIDNAQKRVFFSGAPTQAGVFDYIVRTSGGSGTAEMGGRFTVIGIEPAVLFKHGAGSSSQTIDVGQAIADFNFRWENATTVTVSGVPQGITAIIDNAQKRVFFSGAPTQAGVFDYTVRTSGGSGTAEMGGRFTVIGIEPAVLFKHGAGSSSQTIDVGQAIADFNFRWENATTVTVLSVPQGITAIIDNAQKRVFFSGAPTQAGVFDYTVRTSGGSGTAEMSGRFTVNSVIPAAIFKHGSGSSTQTVSVGQNIAAFNYRWDNATGITITGLPQGIVTTVDVTQKRVFLSGAPTQAGVFNFTATTTGGYQNTSLSGRITVNTLKSSSIINIENEEDNQSNSGITISVFPNPFTSTLSAVSLTDEVISEIEVLTIDGRLILKESKSTKETTLNLSNLSKGWYVVKVTTQTGSAFIKALKK